MTTDDLPPMPRHPAGLCSDCKHRRVTGNRRGSRFYLCELAKTDGSFRRYPPLPVVRCRGYERGAPDPWEALRDESTSDDPADNAFSGDVENDE